MEDKKALSQLILQACHEKEGKKRLACASAFALAKKHKLKISEIGAMCDELEIKISQCQLGCFGN
jgi:hypothetical protein